MQGNKHTVRHHTMIHWYNDTNDTMIPWYNFSIAKIFYKNKDEEQKKHSDSDGVGAK